MIENPSISTLPNSLNKANNKIPSITTCTQCGNSILSSEQPICINCLSKTKTKEIPLLQLIQWFEQYVITPLYQNQWNNQEIYTSFMIALKKQDIKIPTPKQSIYT